MATSLSGKLQLVYAHTVSTQSSQAHKTACRSLLTGQELARLKQDIQKDNGIIQHSFVVPDGHGSDIKLSLWNHPGEDVTGMVGRCRKVAGTMGELLGGEVYHYHTKLMMKEARTGGSFAWHQDYGSVCDWAL